MNSISNTQLKRPGFLLALLVITGCLLIPGALAAVTVSTGTYQIDTVGNTTSIPIVLDSAPNALSGFKVQVNLSNTAVGTITACSFPSWVGMNKKTTLPATGVVISGVDTGMVIRNTDTNILLATLTVQGTAVGSTPITVTVASTGIGVQDTSGTNYPVLTPAGQLTVGTPVTPTVTVTPTVQTPVANFSVDATSGTAPLTIHITDMSVNATTIGYSLGDGTTLSPAPGSVTPYTYVTAGTFILTQTATNAAGSTNKTMTITVNPLPTTETPTPTPTVTVIPDDRPVPNFTLTTPSSMGIQILDNSTNATSVRYDLGDGTTTANRNFRYIYWQAGTFTITLTATNAAGSSVKTVQVTVPSTTPPTTTPTVTPTVTSAGTASFTAVPIASPHGEAVKFTLTPSLGKTIQSTWWTFDKVNHYGTWNSRDINPTFFYPAKGDYTILVKVTYTDGTTETVERPTYVKATWVSTPL